MCTSPITITHRFPTGKVESYLVPCGKCEECRAAYQSEFACKVAAEANARGSLHFFTLTYNDSNLPIAYTDSGHYSAFGRGSEIAAPTLREWSQNGCRCVESKICGLVACPTLFREDVKHWLKKYRSYCDRHSLSKDFAFSVFGEYGERKRRPHYHALFIGLSDDQARVLSNLWTFGFVDLKCIPRFNRDGSDAFILTSNYVSKYIAKRDKLPDFVRDGFAELPRRQSSIGFGLSGLDVEKMRPFLFSGGLQDPSSGATSLRNS